MIPQHALDIVNRLGHFGCIRPQHRTVAQANAYADAMNNRVPFNLQRQDMPVGTKLMLTDTWKDPEVVSDIGQAFTGFYQFTGSCVGVSTGNAAFTVSAVQRKLAASPTKAMIPFWPEDYGLCRGNEGDHGQGEGAVDSVMFQTLIGNGVLPATTSGLPQYKFTPDGIQLSQSIEMQWSNPSGPCTQYTGQAKQFPLKSAATYNSVDDIVAGLQNGYPCLNGCDKYIGNGSVDSNGVCLGSYDGNGGHSTCYLGVWNHPVLGYLLLYSNQWATDTYSDDSSGKGRCTVWVKESNAAKLFSLGGSGGETAGLSGLTGLPAEPAVLNWYA